MRLRDIADRLESLIEGTAEPLLNDGVLHALIQEIRDVHMLYRPIQAIPHIPWTTITTPGRHSRHATSPRQS